MVCLLAYIQYPHSCFQLHVFFEIPDMEKQNMTLESQTILQKTILKNVLGGISRSTLLRLINSGKFPKPRKLGRLNVWAYEDVQKWLDDRKKGDA